MISEDDLNAAVAAGYTTPFDLVDHFGVTPEFMKKAICLHMNGNLATELYF